jgi:GNAT superfamily N-acetyltransferase
MFDCPAEDRKQHWKGDIPLDGDWDIGLIVGPSGSGKTTLAQELFGETFARRLKWNKSTIIDDFKKDLSLETITGALMSVGFNTIPAWLRPYDVLSTGEKFRCDIARLMLECEGDPIVVDEFTSVVDRQVAKATCHAAQKFIRKQGRRFVAVSCHNDIVDWLQPDWILEPATMSFKRRSVRRRPKITVEIRRVDYKAWELFSPYHYMTAQLNKAARCYCLFIKGEPVAFCGILHMPHARVKNVSRISRIVTLPDYQGLGLAFVLMDTLAQAHDALGLRLRNYPAHHALILSHSRSNVWRQTKAAGRFTTKTGATSSTPGLSKQRPNAVFEYNGSPMKDKEAARELLAIGT